MAILTDTKLTALKTSLKLKFDEGLKKQASDWEKIGMKIPSGSASNTYAWLSDFPQMREWVGDRVIKDIKERSYEVQNKKYEATLGVPREAIEDDNYGQYGQVASLQGQAVTRHLNEMIFNALKNGHSNTCYDGQYFFDTDHPVAPNTDGTGTAVSVSNSIAGTGDPWYLISDAAPAIILQERIKPQFDSLDNPNQSDTVFIKDQILYGTRWRGNTAYGFWQCAMRSQATLDQTNFDDAIKQMLEFKADGGRPIGVIPYLLVVPPSLRAAANATIGVERKANGATNPNFKAVSVFVAPWLA